MADPRGKKSKTVQESKAGGVGSALVIQQGHVSHGGVAVSLKDGLVPINDGVVYDLVGVFGGTAAIPSKNKHVEVSLSGVVDGRNSKSNSQHDVVLRLDDVSTVDHGQNLIIDIGGPTVAAMHNISVVIGSSCQSHVALVSTNGASPREVSNWPPKNKSDFVPNPTDLVADAAKQTTIVSVHAVGLQTSEDCVLDGDIHVGLGSNYVTKGPNLASPFFSLNLSGVGINWRK